jgi:hypothetical protein
VYKTGNWDTVSYAIVVCLPSKMRIALSAKAVKPSVEWPVVWYLHGVEISQNRRNTAEERGSGRKKRYDE